MKPIDPYQSKIDFIEQCRDDPVFFVESLMYAEDANPYILEEHQKEFLRCDDSYRMLFWARRLSKSTVLRFDILHKTFFTPSLRALVTLPSWSQANDFGNEIQDVINRSPLVGDMFTKMNATTMTLQNGSRINTASAGKEGVGQLGRGARYLAFDEAQQIPDRVYGYILPIMRGTPGKKYQVFSGTPLGKIGMFWEVYNDAKLLIKDGIATPVECEDPVTGEQFIVFQRQTAYLNEAGEIAESGTNRLTIQELITDRKRMGEVDFLREFCLHWMDTIGEVFPTALIDKCTDRKSTVQFSSFEECVVGIDLGKQRHNSVITVGERQKDGTLKIIFIKSFPLGTRYEEVVKYATKTKLIRSFPHIRKMMIDKTGIGDPVIEQFETATKQLGIQVEGFNFAGPDKKKGLVENGVLQMEQGRVKFVHNQSLVSEMLSYKRVISEKTGKFSYDKPHGGTDDFVDSFLLCVLAHTGTAGIKGKLSVISAGAKVLDRFNPMFHKKERAANVNARYRGFV